MATLPSYVPCTRFVNDIHPVTRMHVDYVPEVPRKIPPLRGQSLQIYEWLKEHPYSRASDIGDAVKLSRSYANTVLFGLEKKGDVHGFIIPTSNGYHAKKPIKFWAVGPKPEGGIQVVFDHRRKT